MDRAPELGQGHAAIGDPKKLARLVERKAEVRRLREQFPTTSERRACELMKIPRMSYRYQSRRDDAPLRERLLELAREKPRYGYRRLHVLLKRENSEGERINHKRVWRVYGDLGLSVRRTRRKRLQRVLRPRPILTAPNQEWAVDFASDVAASGRRIRVFSVTGRAVAKNEAHVAVSTAANSFFVLPSAFLDRDVQIGERLSLRFQQGRPLIENGRDRGR